MFPIANSDVNYATVIGLSVNLHTTPLHTEALDSTTDELAGTHKILANSGFN